MGAPWKTRSLRPGKRGSGSLCSHHTRWVSRSTPLATWPRPSPPLSSSGLECARPFGPAPHPHPREAAKEGPSGGLASVWVPRRPRDENPGGAEMTGSNPGPGARGRGQRPHSRRGPRGIRDRPAARPSPYRLATPTRAPPLGRRERPWHPIGCCCRRATPSAYSARAATAAWSRRPRCGQTGPSVLPRACGSERPGVAGGNPGVAAV